MARVVMNDDDDVVMMMRRDIVVDRPTIVRPTMVSSDRPTMVSSDRTLASVCTFHSPRFMRS